MIGAPPWNGVCVSRYFCFHIFCNEDSQEVTVRAFKSFLILDFFGSPICFVFQFFPFFLPGYGSAYHMSGLGLQSRIVQCGYLAYMRMAAQNMLPWDADRPST